MRTRHHPKSFRIYQSKADIELRCDRELRLHQRGRKGIGWE